jgi:hypothetical protein
MAVGGRDPDLQTADIGIGGQAGEASGRGVEGEPGRERRTVRKRRGVAEPVARIGVEKAGFRDLEGEGDVLGRLLIGQRRGERGAVIGPGHRDPDLGPVVELMLVLDPVAERHHGLLAGTEMVVGRARIVDQLALDDADRAAAGEDLRAGKVQGIAEIGVVVIGEHVEAEHLVLAGSPEIGPGLGRIVLLDRHALR